MKILKMFSGLEFLLEEDEAKNIADNFSEKTLLQLRCGSYINTSGIEAITDPELVSYWNGYKLDKNGSSFMRDGQRIFLETKDFSEIEYKPHPRYKAMKEKLLENTEMFSDKQRTEISEKVARDERDNDILIIK